MLLDVGMLQGFSSIKNYGSHSLCRGHTVCILDTELNINSLSKEMRLGHTTHSKIDI